MEYQNITGPTKAQQEFIEREQMHMLQAGQLPLTVCLD